RSSELVARTQEDPDMSRPGPSRSLLLTVALVVLVCAPAAAAPEGQLTWAVHISLAPTWFDPAETTGIITPFMFLYAMHDALVKSMPGNALAPSLAESWTVSPAYLVSDSLLAMGANCHHGVRVPAVCAQ